MARRSTFCSDANSGIAVAQLFFSRVLIAQAPRWPLKLTLDGCLPSRRALKLLRREDPRSWNAKVRTCKYRNNIVEQGHRSIKW